MGKNSYQMEIEFRHIGNVSSIYAVFLRWKYDMTEQGICPEALKAARKRANGNRGITQGDLARQIGCSVDTVSRWERGATHRVRGHLREPLCKALGVNWDTLTTPPGPEQAKPVGLTRMQRWVSSHVPPALLLVARRYGVNPSDVLDIAPLLFLIAAERSLLERRRRLDEFRAVWNETEPRLLKISAHLGALVAVRNHEADEILEQEEKSLRERDILGNLIDHESRGEDDEGAFVHFIRSLTDGLPQDAVTSIESSYGGDRIVSYRLADDTLRELTGIAGDEQEEQILDHVRKGKIDLAKCLTARGKLDEASYRQWLRNALAVAEEASRRELIELFGGESSLKRFQESLRATVSDAPAADSQEGEIR